MLHEYRRLIVCVCCPRQVGRENLNNLLLGEAEKLERVTVHFGLKLTHIDREGTLHFADSSKVQASTPATYNDYDIGDVLINPALIVGADGAYSATREAMLRLMPMNFSRQYITHGFVVPFFHVKSTNNSFFFFWHTVPPLRSRCAQMTKILNLLMLQLVLLKTKI